MRRSKGDSRRSTAIRDAAGEYATPCIAADGRNAILRRRWILRDAGGCDATRKVATRQGSVRCADRSRMCGRTPWPFVFLAASVLQERHPMISVKRSTLLSLAALLLLATPSAWGAERMQGGQWEMTSLVRGHSQTSTHCVTSDE